MKYLYTTLFAVASLAVSISASGNTVINNGGNGEPNLDGSSGILDNAFVLTNLSRQDDDLLDQYWTADGEVTVTIIAKHAGNTQNFGYFNNGTFVSLISPAGTPGVATSFTPGGSFAFGLQSNGSEFSSVQANNDNDLDHMVTWLITAGANKDDYVIAWEDLADLGDQDYNDLVVRVSGIGGDKNAVPVPAAVWLFGSGLLGLVAVAHRKA